MPSLQFAGKNWSPEDIDTAEETVLRVVAVHEPPFVSIRQEDDGSLTYDGYLFDIWKIMTQLLNLRYQMVPQMEDGGYGMLLENGTWTGMVGELAYGRADVALTWLWMREDRLRVINYLDAVPVEQSTDALYISTEATDDVVLNGEVMSSLLNPLQVNVWWVLLGTLLLLSLALRATVSFSGAEDTQTAGELTWTGCVQATFMSLVGQGWPSMPASLSGRTIALLLWMLYIIIHSGYTANLISHLTVSGDVRPITSLKQFSERPDWKLGMYPTHVILNDWRFSNDTYERQLYDRALNKDRFVPFYSDEESARNLVKPKVMAFIALEQLFYLIGDDACRLVPLQFKPKRKTLSYMVVAKGLTQKRLMNKALRKMNEVGLIVKLRKKWMKDSGICMYNADVKPLSLNNVVALLIIVPTGLAISFIVFTCEIVWYKWLSKLAVRKSSTRMLFTRVR